MDFRDFPFNILYMYGIALLMTSLFIIAKHGMRCLNIEDVNEVNMGRYLEGHTYFRIVVSNSSVSQFERKPYL